jgi:ribonuclease G
LPDWLIERGIGETRAVRLEAGEIAEARVTLDEVVPAGTVLEARLLRVGVPAIAEANGAEYLLPAGTPGITQGAALAVEVTRERIPGAEPWKRPLARVTKDAPRPAPSLDSKLLTFPSTDDRLEQAGWSDLLEEARSGIIRFAGGDLRVSPTPAMTLIDVDGRIPAFELAVAGAQAAARTILRHGIGGSIGIDLPTVAGKAQRQQIADALDAMLPQPFERTAVNGFGFLQIVRARTHASLFELAADRAAFEARALLRRAAVERTGAVRLVAHPAVIAVLEGRPGWLDALARQVGGSVGLRAGTALPISGAYAEAG